MVWRSRYLSQTKRNLSVDNACHNALCSTNDDTKAHMAAVRRLHKLCFIQLFVDAISQFDIKDTISDGKRYCISKYNNKASNRYPLQATLCKYL